MITCLENVFIQHFVRFEGMDSTNAKSSIIKNQPSVLKNVVHSKLSTEQLPTTTTVCSFSTWTGMPLLYYFYYYYSCIDGRTHSGQD